MEMAFASGNRVESITGNTVSGNYFFALGLTPVLGRVFTTADEEHDARIAVLSYGFWRRAFAGREDAVGRTIHLRGSPFTVVGVLQPGFVDLDLENRPDIWVPISAWKSWTGKADDVPSQLYMRLRGGVPVAQAEADVRSLFPAMIAAEFAGQPGVTSDAKIPERAMRPTLASAERGVSTLRKQFTGAVTAVMGGVAALLLLVCGNIGGLMLARAETHT
jgi:hypothetical protein